MTRAEKIEAAAIAYLRTRGLHDGDCECAGCMLALAVADPNPPHGHCEAGAGGCVVCDEQARRDPTAAPSSAAIVREPAQDSSPVRGSSVQSTADNRSPTHAVGGGHDRQPARAAVGYVAAWTEGDAQRVEVPVWSDSSTLRVRVRARDWPCD